MAKTPISILQEYMVSKKEKLPDYYIENCNNGMASFKCTVRAGSIKAVGYASTKKEAKQNSAKKALEILGSSQNLSEDKRIVVFDHTTEPTNFVGSSRSISGQNRAMQLGHFVNFVGTLNELASTNGKPYPIYHDNPLLSANGLFTARCIFLNFIAEGYGNKKKDAKQDAAAKMLHKLKDQDLSLISVAMQDLHVENEIKVKNLTEEVLRSYNKLTTTVDVTPLPNNFLFLKDLKKRVSSLEDFGIELKKYGYKYTIKTFQSEPYIMMMKINDTTITVMGAGKNKQEALNDLYESVVTMLEHGFTLKTTF